MDKSRSTQPDVKTTHEENGPATPTQITGIACLEPEFLTIPAACRFSGIGRTEIYLLIRDRHIKSISLRKKGAARGRRLISVQSLRSYLHRFIDEEQI
jgi:hypothetical protein